MPHALTRAVAEARSILLTTPDLDGDAVGSIVALSIALERRWPGRRIVVATDEPLPERYAFLASGVRFQVTADLDEAPFDLALVLDGDPTRLGQIGAYFLGAGINGLVDHHKSSVHCDVGIAFLDPACSSTAEMVLRLCDHWGVPLDAELAEAIWAGMVFDTSVFRYRLTRPATLRAAARLLETGIDHARIVEQVLLQQSFGKVRLRSTMIGKMHRGAGGRLAWAALTAEEIGTAETGGLVDDLVFIEGVEVGALVYEKRGKVRVSLRSRGGVDVSEMARGLTPRGGGHARAAGATLAMSVDEAVKAVVDAATATLSELADAAR